MSPFDADTNVADGSDDFRLVSDEDKTPEPEVEAEPVAPLSYITAPLDLIEAAMSCASTEKTRYYLNGCFIHAHDGSVRVVSTDGTRLFVASFDPDVDGDLPGWLTPGVLVPLSLFKTRFKLLRETVDRSSGQPVVCRIGYGDKAAKLEVTDYWNEIALRAPPINGTFPDYNRLIGGIDMSGSADVQPLDFVSFDQRYLNDVASMSRILGAKSVNIIRQSDPTDPTVITFAERPEAALMLMPLRVEKAVTVKTVALLAPAMKGTLAALKANETRNRVKADDETLPTIMRNEHRAKADALALKIQMILEGTTPRLAAPEPQPEPESAMIADLPGEAVEAALATIAAFQASDSADEPRLAASDALAPDEPTAGSLTAFQANVIKLADKWDAEDAAEAAAAAPEAPAPSVYERKLSKRYRKEAVTA